MRNLDDILAGFLVFFTIDRIIQLLGVTVIEPWAKSKTSNEKEIKAIHLGSEIIALIIAAVVVFRFHKEIGKIRA
jgi:hypothetical protein